MGRSQEVFVSYAHEDLRWHDDFLRMLAPAEEQGIIRVWSDECIGAGKEWAPNIDKALARAKVALLLVSDHFLRSTFITRVELTRLVQGARTGGVSIRWVLVSPCMYQFTPLRDLQASWDPEKPLNTLPEADRGVVIQKICEEIVEEFGIQPVVSEKRQDALRGRVQELLEDYELGETVGSGKFSIVYRAERTTSKLVVAVKVFVASELDEGARRLFGEAVRRAHALTSPAFIRMFYDSMQDVPFLVTEFIDGEPLCGVLRNHPHGLPLDRVKQMLLDLATAIEEAHERGFRRGEMCPSNILIERSGRPRLSPFDFTNVLREQVQITSNMFLDREALAYMTPERYFGQEPTERTDQYSLGLIASELLGGARMPAVVRPCDLEVKRDLFARFESGDGDWAKRSAAFRGLVCKMLCLDPQGRWPSMRVVREMLSQIEVPESPEEAHRAKAKASYLRIQGQQRFFEKLYENLFSALPDVRTHFESLDMRQQYHVLNNAIYTLLSFREECANDRTTLDLLASRHVRFGLTEHHHRMFLEALVTTLEDFGEGAPDLLEAWRSSVTPGLDFMWTCQKERPPSRAAGGPPP